MISDITDGSNEIVWKALEFATYKHRLQRRKGYQRLPYINHPIKVAGILKHFGETKDELIAAALLHDVLEDTDATEKELETSFGRYVMDIVLEVTDDMKLPSKERKKLQIQHAAGLSDEAKKIKISDKTANTIDLYSHPISWSKARKKGYILWATEVVKECRGVNQSLEENFFLEADICIKKLDDKK